MYASLLVAALKAVDKLFGGPEVRVPVELPGKPVPASRPRVTRYGRTYYAKTYRNWRRSAEARLDAKDNQPLSGPVAVVTEVIYPVPKSGTHRKWPQGDNDNYEKAAWDVAVKGEVLEDDDQIVCNMTVKRYAGKHEQDGVFLNFYPLKKPEG